MIIFDPLSCNKNGCLQLITADYVVVGTGLSGLSFADTIISGSDATVAMIDFNAAPGGYWQTSHDYMRLDTPNLMAGLNGVALARDRGRKIQKRVQPTLTTRDMQAYFQRAMTEHLLESDRVQYFSDCYHLGSGIAQAVGWNTRVHFKANRKIVDATQCWHRTALSHIPCFQAARDVMVATPRDFSALWSLGPHMYEKYCVIGAGSTGVETVSHLLELGVTADEICWVKPRDAWYWNADQLAPSDWLEVLEIIADTDALSQIGLALERSGHILRVDPDVTPMKFHGALKSPEQLNAVRHIHHVVRKGHVHHLTAKGMFLEQGAEPMPKRTLYIDCTASRVATRSQAPVFDHDTINLQMLQMASAGFSAAMIAAIEMLAIPEDEKATLCQPLSHPDYPTDIAVLLKQCFENQKLWLAQPALRVWLSKNQIGITSALLSALTRPSDVQISAEASYRRILPRALKALGAQIERDALFDWSEFSGPSPNRSPSVRGPE